VAEARPQDDRPLAAGNVQPTRRPLNERVVSSLPCVALLAILVAACGVTSSNGDGSGPALLSGSAAGRAFSYANEAALFAGDALFLGPTNTGSIVVVFSNRADYCSLEQAYEDIAGMDFWELVIQWPHGWAPPGTYTVDGAAVSGGYEILDQACGIKYFDGATSGTIDLSVVNSTVVSGSFDVTLRTGEHVAVSFSAPVCPLSPDGGLRVNRCIAP
jgi:hypothetical protein